MGPHWHQQKLSLEEWGSVSALPSPCHDEEDFYEDSLTSSLGCDCVTCDVFAPCFHSCTCPCYDASLCSHYACKKKQVTTNGQSRE